MKALVRKFLIDGTHMTSGVIWQCTPDPERERKSCCKEVVVLATERESLELQR